MTTDHSFEFKILWAQDSKAVLMGYTMWKEEKGKKALQVIQPVTIMLVCFKLWK